MTQANSCGTPKSLADYNTSDLVLMPDKIAIRRRVEIPMKTADAAAAFGTLIDVLAVVPANGGAVIDGVTVESQLLGGTAVNCPFLMCGVCVTVVPDQIYGTGNGLVFDVGTDGNTGPDAIEFNGGMTVTGETGRALGTLEFGLAAQRASLELLLAYKLRFLLQCKYPLFEINLSEIGCVESPAAQEGNSSFLVSGDEYARKSNERYAAIGNVERFMFPNRLGASTGAENTFLEQAPRPTVAAAIGGLDAKGNFNGYFGCPYPVLLSPCCRLNMEMVSLGSIANIHLGLLQDQLTVPQRAPMVPEMNRAPADEAFGLGSQLVHIHRWGTFEFQINLVGYYIESAACQEYAQSDVVPAAILEVMRNQGAFRLSAEQRDP